jgi:transcription-repair coupling factor (superfamily II helicase)
MDKIKHLKNKYSVARYDLICDCDGDEMKLYLYLKLYAINKHEAFPTYRTIKEDLGWGFGKISKLIKKMVNLGHLKIGKREVKTRGGKQPANVYDITWYDKLNEKGSFQKGTKGFPNGNTLPLKGVSKSGAEQVESITNNNITSSDAFNNISLDERRRNIVKLAEMKKVLFK